MTLREFIIKILESKCDLDSDYEEIIEEVLTELWKERKLNNAR